MLTLMMLSFLGATREDMPVALLGRYELDCPVCRQTFTTRTCTQTNTRGGVDRDLFARALGPQPEFYRIATCPKCGYSGYDPDFDPGVSIPPDVREKILRAPRLKLPEGFGPGSDPRELDASDRYALAITCYEWRGKPDEALAWLHLRASWVARETGAILPPDPRLARVMDFVGRWRPPLAPEGNQVDVEMQTAARIAEAILTGRFNRFQEPYVELALALILRRHGENRQAAPLLARLAAYEDFSQDLKDGIARMQDTIARERKHQAAAAVAFERALLARQITGPNHAPACYLLAELLRRLDRDQESADWYDRALADASLPANLRTWAAEQRRWAAGGPPGLSRR